MAVQKTEVVVIGAGPGGYTAAFRAADLGKKVTLIEYYDKLGGVCLNVGCIPSKAMLHAAEILDEANHAKDMGISYTKPKIDIKQLRKWVEKNTIDRLTTGLSGLASMRKVKVLNGHAEFATANSLTVTSTDGKKTTVEFEQAVIAVGSRPVKLPFMPEDDRVMDSTGALELNDLPKSLLVLGGGIIGMEMGTVYQALGSKVTVVEMMPTLLGGADKDLVAPLQKKMSGKFEDILLETKVVAVDAKKDGLYVTFEGKNAPKKPVKFDKILCSVGRIPNGNNVGAQNAGVNVTDKGFIETDEQQRTNVPHIFAIGDVTGNPMLAHRAIPQGKVAAEVISGMKHFFNPRCIPSVAYTSPEVAWVGLSEQEAKEKGIKVGRGVFPWMASGKALAIGVGDEGYLTKVIFDKDTNKIIGAGVTGPNAGDLIGEATLAIEMGADAEDIALTIHPHPTLVETLCQATEMYEGTITDMPPQNK